MHREVLTSQYIRLATEANWLLWDCLLCNLLQYLTKLPLFTTKCSFHRRQTVGSLCPAENGRGKRTSLAEKSSIKYILRKDVLKHHIPACQKQPTSRGFYSHTNNNQSWFTDKLYDGNLPGNISVVFIITRLGAMWTLKTTSTDLAYTCVQLFPKGNFQHLW